MKLHMNYIYTPHNYIRITYISYVIPYVITYELHMNYIYLCCVLLNILVCSLLCCYFGLVGLGRATWPTYRGRLSPRPLTILQSVANCIDGIDLQSTRQRGGTRFPTTNIRDYRPIHNISTANMPLGRKASDANCKDGSDLYSTWVQQTHFSESLADRLSQLRTHGPKHTDPMNMHTVIAVKPA